MSAPYRPAAESLRPQGMPIDATDADVDGKRAWTPSSSSSASSSSSPSSVWEPPSPVESASSASPSSSVAELPSSPSAPAPRQPPPSPLLDRPTPDAAVTSDRHTACAASMMPDASSRERGGSGDGGRCTVAVPAGDARGPSVDDRVSGVASGGDASDAAHEGDDGSRGPDAAGSPGDDMIEVEPDDGDGGGRVTLLTLVHTGASEFSPDVPQKLASNERSETRNASDGGTQRGGPKPGGADGVDGFVEATQSSPPPPTAACVPASDARPPAASGGVASATNNAVPVGSSEADAATAVPSSVKSVGVGGGESTLSPGGGLPRVGDTVMLDGIDSRAPGPSGTAGDGGVPW